MLMATLIGDVVASRRADDREVLHRRLTALLADVNEVCAPTTPLRITVGDEFQGTFETVGQALQASLRLRIGLLPDHDMRHGIGWGEVKVLQQDPRVEDGPGWWAAREAIEWTASAQRQPGLALVRTSLRAAPETRTDVDAINAALICRDHLLGSIDDRSTRIVKALLENRTKKDIAATEGISPSAVSQRSGRDGLDLIVVASEYLRSLP